VVGVAAGDCLPVGGAGGVRLALLLLEPAEEDHRSGGVVGVVKIWRTSDASIVYDNWMGVSSNVNAADPQLISGGRS